MSELTIFRVSLRMNQLISLDHYKLKSSASVMNAGRLSQGPKPKTQIGRSVVQEEQKRNLQLNGDTIMNENKPVNPARYADSNQGKYMKPSSYSNIDSDRQTLLTENERLKRVEFLSS